MKENFDDILRRRWDERRFDIDTDHREEMIHLLDGQTTRRIVPFWWIAGAGFLILSIGLWFFLARSGSLSPHHPPHGTSRDIESPILSSDTRQAQETEGIHHLDLQEEKSTQYSKLPSESTVSSPDLDPVTSVTSNVSTSPSGSPASPNHSEHQNIIPAPKSNPAQHVQSSNPVPTKSEGRNSNKQAAPDQSPTLLPGHAAAPLSEENPQQTLPNTLPEEATQVRSSSGSIVAQSQESLPPEAIAESPYASRSNRISEPLALLILEESFHHQTHLVEPIEPHIKATRPWSLFAEAGAGIVLGAQPDFSSGWKLRAGMGAGYALNSRLQFIGAAGYLMQQGGFSFQRSSTVQHHGFGTRSSFNTLEPDRLHFIYGRLGMQYRLRRHIAGVFAGGQYLYGAQGAIEVYTQEQFASADMRQRRYTWLNTRGLTLWHWTGHLVYGYQLAPRLIAQAGTDIYFSTFTDTDPALAAEGYYWKGRLSSFHPFLSLNYTLYERR